MKDIDKFRQEIKKLRQEIKDEKDPLAPNQKAGYLFALTDMESFLDTLSEESDKSLEEAAEKYAKQYAKETKPKDADGEIWKVGDVMIENQMSFEDGFKAGAEWQKAQDQPIIGNSLEKEWLRYVDKKKKECGGELPALGEYGWLQIARHFAEWQASQMPMPEDTVLFQKGVAEGRRLEREDMLKDAVESEAEELYNDGESQCTVGVGTHFKPGDKVYVLKAEEE